MDKLVKVFISSLLSYSRASMIDENVPHVRGRRISNASGANNGGGGAAMFTKEDTDGINVFQELTPEELDRLQRDDRAEKEFHRYWRKACA